MHTAIIIITPLNSVRVVDAQPVYKPGRRVIC